MTAGKQSLIEVSKLAKWFPIRRGIALRTVGHVKAVDNVSFEIYKGETLGLVGESGCGKSTLARSLLRLIEPTAGSIVYEGEDFLRANRRNLKNMRKNMQIVFQDPFGSLHPKMRVGEILEEPLIISRYGDAAKRKERVNELIELVSMRTEYLTRFPHEFSGGQRQRIVIARALATNPGFVICDEPVSALDVSVRSQILNLLEDLQEGLSLTYLFISHDLSVIEHICDRIIVMYLGRVVEKADKRQLFDNPLHPYTQALLSAVPQVRAADRKGRVTLEGDIPSPANPPSGCHFHTRCPKAQERCKTDAPELRDMGDGHLACCHYCG